VNEFIKERKSYDAYPLSQSSIACALGCERNWFFRYRWHLKPKDREFRKAADLGTIYHLMMKKGPTKLEEVLKWVKDRQAVLMEEVDEFGGYSDEVVKHVNDLTDMYNRAKCMAELFWEKFPRGEDRETLFREQYLEMDDLCGTIDEVEHKISTNTISIRDTKTTTRELKAVVTGYRFGIQARLYRLLVDDWAAKNGHKSPSGFILDVVRMPNIKLCGTDVKKANKLHITPAEAYKMRVLEWYEDNGIAAMNCVAMPFEEPIMTDELDRVLETVRDMANREPDPRNYSRDMSRRCCYKFNKQCPFHSLCDMDISLWPAELHREYTTYEKVEKGVLS